MYPRPQRIWVAGLVCQSAPALAILDPGSACGMPNAPDVGLVAAGFQPLSRFQRLCRHPNWLDDQPNEPSIAIAICWGDPEGVAGLGAEGAGGWAACWAARWGACGLAVPLGLGALYLPAAPGLAGQPSAQSPVGGFFPASVVHVLAASVW